MQNQRLRCRQFSPPLRHHRPHRGRTWSSRSIYSIRIRIRIAVAVVAAAVVVVVARGQVA